jgi:hypothetical protein
VKEGFMLVATEVVELSLGQKGLDKFLCCGASLYKVLGDHL